jgi:hypothetical protein
MSIVENDEHCLIICDFIRTQSPLKKAIDWNRVAGVGYSINSIPFGIEKLDAFKILYLALIPQGESSEMELVSIGYLDDSYK